MLADPTTGERVSYIPVNIIEGGESAPVTLTITPEVEGAEMSTPVSPSAAVWGRISPDAYQNLAVTPLDLSAAFGSSVDVDFKVIAAAPLPGVTRVVIPARIPKRQAAAWLG